VNDRPWIWRPGEPVHRLRRLLDRGGVLAVPTESTYGLAVDPLNQSAVELVYEIKDRDRGKPLPVIASSLAQVEQLGADLEDPSLRALAELWPAALTLLIPIRGQVAAAAGASRLAVRVPDHEMLRELLEQLDMPLTATSANLSGSEPARSVEEVDRLLSGYDAAIVAGGKLPGGPPSTIASIEGGRLRVLREGRVPVSALRAKLGEVDET